MALGQATNNGEEKKADKIKKLIMKKILFITALLFFISFLCFSQENVKTAIDSASAKKKNNNKKTPTWKDFLSDNINMNVPAENGAPIGQYDVVIRFTVDTTGSLVDFLPMTHFGYGMENEVIRVLKKSPLWTPGIQNGHKVKSIHYQPITFDVTE